MDVSDHDKVAGAARSWHGIVWQQGSWWVLTFGPAHGRQHNVSGGEMGCNLEHAVRLDASERLEHVQCQTRTCGDRTVRHGLLGQGSADAAGPDRLRAMY